MSTQSAKELIIMLFSLAVNLWQCRGRLSLESCIVTVHCAGTSCGAHSISHTFLRCRVLWVCCFRCSRCIITKPWIHWKHEIFLKNKNPQISKLLEQLNKQCNLVQFIISSQGIICQSAGECTLYQHIDATDIKQILYFQSFTFIFHSNYQKLCHCHKY